MKLEIVTPSQNVASDEADEVYAQGPKGEFGVLPGFAHYVTPLKIGRLYYTKQGKRVSFVIEGGLMEVFHDKVVVMADQIERAEQIDATKAKAELQKIEQKLSQESMDAAAFQSLLRQRILEEARIAVASEKH